MILVVDTHTLIWHLSDDPRLGPRADEILIRRTDLEIVVPIIVLFEITHLQKKRRLPISM